MRPWTEQRIAELRALAEKATPGPWQVGDGKVAVLDADGEHVALVHQRYANSAFIVAARIDLPEALECIERLWVIVQNAEAHSYRMMLRMESAEALLKEAWPEWMPPTGLPPLPDVYPNRALIVEEHSAVDAIERVRAICMDVPKEDVWGEPRRFAKAVLTALEGENV